MKLPAVILCCVLASLAPAAASARVKSGTATFRASIRGAQDSQSSGTMRCGDDADSTAPVSSSEQFSFASRSHPELAFSRDANGVVTITGFRTANARLPVKAIDTRTSTVGGPGGPEGCPNGAPPPGCGTVQFPHLGFMLYGGKRNFSVVFLGDSRESCPTLAVVAAPELLGGVDLKGGPKLSYRARIPGSALLNKHKRTLIVHGKATTSGFGKTPPVELVSGTTSTTLTYTLKLVRVRGLTRVG